jgi:hypothetical protein
MMLQLRSSLIVCLGLLPALIVSGQVKFTTVVSSQELGQRDYLQVQYIVENAQQIDGVRPSGRFSGISCGRGSDPEQRDERHQWECVPVQGAFFCITADAHGQVHDCGCHRRSEWQEDAVQQYYRLPSIRAGPEQRLPIPAVSADSRGCSPSVPTRFGPPAPEAVDREDVLRPGENVKEKINKNLFVKVQVDRNTCYVGEPIVATYKLYSRFNADSRVTRTPLR